MKPVVCTLLLAILVTVAQGQKTTAVLRPLDTMEVVITPLVYMVQDTAYNCFMWTEPNGAFGFFVSRESLNEYLETVSSSIWFQSEAPHYRVGYGYVKRYTEIAQPDTVHSYRSMSADQIDREGAREDTMGYPLLLHDLEHSYILQRMGHQVHGHYVYCLINEGQKFFGSTIPPPKSTLVALDLEQDTTSNFFVFKARSVSDAGMEFIGSDTLIIPLKKLRKKYSLTTELDQLMSIKKESDVHYLNAQKTYVLIIGDKRFVLSTDIYRRERVEDEWVQLLESIVSTIEHMQRKYVK